MDLNIKIREINNSEISQLGNFLYEAIYITEGQEKTERELINQPELMRYIKDFGQTNDICLVAELDGYLVGAIWTRIFKGTEHGYGHVDSNTPELSMSVLPKYQQKGIGTKLLREMIDRLINCNYKQVSLSVDKHNNALRLYQRFGFTILDSDKKSAIMIKNLKFKKE